MSTPFLAEIRLISFNFAPKGWALCNGQLLAINQNQALFSVLGVYYGGNGQTNFALPDLRGRAPFHSVSRLGQRTGQETHTLTPAELPAHSHALNASSAAGTAASPAGNVLAPTREGAPLYGPVPDTALHSATVLPVGGSQAHNNLPPSLVLNYVIALQGIFPSRN